MTFSTSDWHRLTDDVWIATCEPENVNVGLIVGTDAVVMVDAGAHPDLGARLANQARDLIGRDVDTCIVTHDHYDHWFGVAGVGAARIIGHESLSALATSEDTAKLASEHSIEPSKVLAPTDPFALARFIDLGGVRLEIIHFGAGHSASDVIVRVLDRDVIFAGDLVEESADPNVGPDSDLPTWVKVLDALIGTSQDKTIVVPGHGVCVDQAFVINQRAALAMVSAEVDHLIATGVTRAAASTAADWPFSEATMATTLDLAYANAPRGIEVGKQLPLI